jgi:ATP-dependent DNA helicase RecQ
LVEPKYFDTTKKARVVAAEERKRKAAEREAGNSRPAKRARTENGSRTTKPSPHGVHRSTADPNERSEHAPVEHNQDQSNRVQTGHLEVPSTITNSQNTTTIIPDDASRAAFEALRRAAYAEVPKTDRKRTKRKVDEIEPALDDMINAASRQEIRCFRLPAIVYFAQRKNGLSFCLGASFRTHGFTYVYRFGSHRLRP